MRRWAEGVVYHWIDKRGRIPRWARWFWPWAHFCCEMDDLLILGNTFDCFCGYCKRSIRDYTE